jgi:hypothetical protein
LFDNDDDDCIFTNYGQPLKAGRIVWGKILIYSQKPCFYFKKNATLNDISSSP